MKVYTMQDVKNLLLLICGICQDNQELLTEADSKQGDGDMGISMGKGAAALQKKLAESDGTEDLTELFLGCAAAFNRAAPSTLGTLISFGMMTVAKELAHKKEIPENEAAGLVRVFTETIAGRGKAKPGDKTILDALYPYAEALENGYQETGSLRDALPEALKAARKGMESTRGMKAKTGRASWLDGRNMDFPDAGTVLCVTIAEGVEKEYALSMS